MADIVTFPLNEIDYGAEDMETYFCTRKSGVFSAENHFTAEITGNRQITIGVGLAWMNTSFFSGKSAALVSPQALSIDIADGAISRIDRIVLRWDKARNMTDLVVKKGTLSANPVAQTLVRTPEIYELALYDISIPKASIVISKSHLIDQRLNDSVCGLMRDGVTGIPTQTLYDNFWTWFNALKLDAEQKAAVFSEWMYNFMTSNEENLSEWLANFKSGSQINFNEWFTSFKSVNSTIYYNWYNSFKSNSETDFFDWFQNLQNQLDDNQAANLQNQINRHLSDTMESDTGVHGERYKDGKLQIKLAAGWVTVAKVIEGLTSTYIDGLMLSSIAIDSKQYTSDQINKLIEMEE